MHSQPARFQSAQIAREAFCAVRENAPRIGRRERFRAGRRIRIGQARTTESVCGETMKGVE